MSEQDWAEKIVEEIWKRAFNKPYYNYSAEELNISLVTVAKLMLQALRQEREITTLEMEAKWKKIVWPDNPISHKAFLRSFEHSNFTDTTCYDSAWRHAIDWLKEWVEAKRK